MIYFFLIFLFFSLYLYWSRWFDYWKIRGVPFVPSSTFTVIKSLTYDSVPLLDRYSTIYRQLSGHKYGGCFKYFTPQFVVRDPELIQHILNQDFEYFRDRGSVLFNDRDPLTNHIFSAPANLWRNLRIRLTPTFTTGKMKYMFGLVKECAEEYQQVIQKSSICGTTVDVKELSASYTIEVISSAAFGLKTNSMANPDSEFRKMASKIFDNRIRIQLQRFISEMFPKWKSFSIHIHSNEVSEFFFRIVRETIVFRKRTGFKRNDFLQILIGLNDTTSNSANEKTDGDDNMCSKPKENQFVMTNDLMTAQCFLFFIAGFDTSSFVLSMTLLELALNLDIQDKLCKEIDHSTEEGGADITYDMIKNMAYLHKVVQETMRKYPVLPFISRICGKTYQIPDTQFKIEKGTEVIIPVPGIHLDAQYYPNPQKYDPERFSEEEINARHKFVYLPFGAGPRNCIGSRFGLMSVKLGIVHLLHKFNFHTTPETVHPVKFKPFKLVTDSMHKVVLKCTLRKSVPEEQAY